MPLKIIGILQFWCEVFYKSQLDRVAWLYFSDLVFYPFLCTCMHVHAQLLICVQGWNPSLLFLLHWQADALPLSHLGSHLVYTYSISYIERSVYQTAVSLSSPALPLAVQLWQALLALIDQFLSVLFLTLLWRIFALHLRQGPGTSLGSVSALALHLAFHMVPLSIQWRSMGKSWWVRKTYSVDEVARISDYNTCPLRTMASVLKVFVHSPKPYPWWSFPLQTSPWAINSVQLLSCVQLFATLWTAAFQAWLSITNSCSLLKLMSIESVMPSSGIPFPSCLQSFPASGSFPISQFFASGGQSIGVSPPASVLPMNIQDWFPLGWTGWISLQSKGLSRVFCNTTVQKHEPSVSLFFLAAPYGVPDLSSSTRNWTLASCSGSTRRNHWTSREVLDHLFLLSQNVFILFWNLVHLHSQVTDEFF